MAKEYALIVERGYVLQLDAPDLAMERSVMWKDRPLSDFLDAAALHVAAINEAVRGLPADQIGRAHV